VIEKLNIDHGNALFIRYAAIIQPSGVHVLYHLHVKCTLYLLTSDISWYSFVYIRYIYCMSMIGERIRFIRTEWTSSKKTRPREILVNLTHLCIVTVHSLVHEFKARAVFASNILYILRERRKIDSRGCGK